MYGQIYVGVKVRRDLLFQVTCYDQEKQEPEPEKISGKVCLCNATKPQDTPDWLFCPVCGKRWRFKHTSLPKKTRKWNGCITSNIPDVEAQIQKLNQKGKYQFSDPFGLDEAIVPDWEDFSNLWFEQGPGSRILALDTSQAGRPIYLYPLYEDSWVFYIPLKDRELRSPAGIQQDIDEVRRYLASLRIYTTEGEGVFIIED